MKLKVSEPMDKSCPPNTSSDKDIIKKILLEKESDIAVKDKMYRILYEASQTDEVNMDTNLIDECVKTIGLIEGDEQHIPIEKMQAMRQNADRKYKDWQKAQRRHQIKKSFAQIAACLVITLFMFSIVANAFGYNPIQMIVHWGEDTFNLSTQRQSGSKDNNNIKSPDNITSNVTFDSIDKAFIGIDTKPLLPVWVPEGFIFKYAERFNRKDNINVLLYYSNDENKVIIFDFTIFDDSNETARDTSFDKDDSSVQVYEKNNVKHYIFKNVGQVQAVWSNLNIVYNITGDISVEETKKIINSMYGG